MDEAAAGVFSAAAAIHGVTAVKTCPAQRQTSHGGRQILHPHISQGVRPDNPADFFDRMGGSQELAVRRYICAKVTRVQERGRTDSYMDFLCACLLEHMYQVGDGRAAHDGVVYQHDIFAFYSTFKNA